MTRVLYGLCGQDAGCHFSPHVWKAIMSLHHKGLDFELKTVPFTEIPELEGGVSKTVPILNDNGKIVADSFAIALYLEETYPERPSLFGGEGGKAMARVIEGYSAAFIHPAVTKTSLMDIHAMLAPKDQDYFRTSRETRFGRTLEEVAAQREAEIATFADKLAGVRHALSFNPYLGGEHPLFCDYIIFGALQWARICNPVDLLADGDPVKAWFERCLDLYDGVGRSVRRA